MSFEKKKPKEFDIDDDYQSVYADGIIVSPEDNDTVKLIFYENTHEFDPKFGYDKSKKISRLKFEVRISSYVLEKLATQSLQATLPNSVIDFAKIQQLNKLKPSVVKEIDKLSDSVIAQTFDTDNPVHNADIDSIYQSVMDRMLRETEDG